MGCSCDLVIVVENSAIKLSFLGYPFYRLNHLTEPENIETNEEKEDTTSHPPILQSESRSQRAGANSSSARVSSPAQDTEQDSVASVDSDASSVASSDPAGHVVHNILSRSMDDFMKTYRHRGNRTAQRSNSNGSRERRGKRREKSADERSRSTSPAMHSDGDDDGASQASNSMSRTPGVRGTSKSPSRLRLRTGALLTSLRDSQRLGRGDRFKRYMQMTESQSLGRSMSPNGTIGAVDVSAVRWEYDNVQLKPIWKVPNTYQSPGRARSTSQGNSQSNSRANSVSPGARTTASLIERLAQQDRYAAMHGAAALAGEKDSTGPAAVSFSFTAQGKGTTVPAVSAVIDNADCVSVASSVSMKTTTTTTSTTTSAKH